MPWDFSFALQSVTMNKKDANPQEERDVSSAQESVSLPDDIGDVYDAYVWSNYTAFGRDPSEDEDLPTRETVLSWGPSSAYDPDVCPCPHEGFLSTIFRHLRLDDDKRWQKWNYPPILIETIPKGSVKRWTELEPSVATCSGCSNWYQLMTGFNPWRDLR